MTAGTHPRTREAYRPRKSVTAGNTAAKAVDGDIDTRWESARGADPQWLEVDLGSAQAVGHVELDWERAAAKSYALQLSDDGKTWQTVYSTTTSTGGKQSVPASGTGRFVRMYGTARTTQYGYSLYELRVYAPNGSAPSPGPSGDAPISGLSLVDDKTRQPVSGFDPLRDGAVVDLAELPDPHLSLRAESPSAATVGSVAFTLTDTHGSTYTRVENKTPFFLCNDFIDCPQLLVADTYTVTVRAFSAADGKGSTLGAPLTVRFTVRSDATPT